MGGYTILIPGVEDRTPRERRTAHLWKQVLEPDEFFEGVFDGRMLFGLPTGVNTKLEIGTGEIACPWCEGTTRIAVGLTARIGPHWLWSGLEMVDAIPRLRERLRQAVTEHPQMGEVKHASECDVMARKRGPWWWVTEAGGKGKDCYLENVRGMYTANWCVDCSEPIDRSTSTAPGQSKTTRSDRSHSNSTTKHLQR